MNLFANLLSELENLSKTKTITMGIDPDKDGYLDKECPSKECKFIFKVHLDDWTNKLKSNKIYCPKCGHVDESNCWYTSEQLIKSTEVGIKIVKSRIAKAISKDAKEFNRSQSNDSFIKMSMAVKGANREEDFLIPLPAKDEMEQKVTCSACKARYAVIGSAFFCPSCGHNSAEATFENTIKVIESYLKNLPVIKKAVAQFSLDEAENTERGILEKGILDCIVSFQRFCEVSYKRINPSGAIPFNAFQKLDVGGKLWFDICGESYSDWLTKEEYQRLIILFQRRHLLQHTEGIVDMKYIEKTNDTLYKVGQRIVVNVVDIRELISYVKRLTNKVKAL
jgi:predicted RNA-binding Zn-ribbon protein involved in translation (DUF1610 family)